MAKRCRECSTITGNDSPYCEACGCQFSSKPAESIHFPFWQFMSIGVVIAVVGTAIYYFGVR